MMEKLTPTKANLIKAQTMLEFSKKGYELLDKKRNVLIREMMSMIDEVKKLQEEIDNIFKETYAAIQLAILTMGVGAVEEIAFSIPKNEEFTILSKSVMGVEMPFLKSKDSALQPTYGFYRTNPALDIVVTKMKKVQNLLYRTAEIENSVFRLAIEIKSTSKRANALDKIQIPKYAEMIKNITEVLEEREREDFFRLKRMTHLDRK
ncbi:MAG: V-type ATP synthase subunit D [Peptostreptococcaceae bacterium]|nr:V-type ATP synthase subunit D [Peptostreptococcaceae bacterium]